MSLDLSEIKELFGDDIESINDFLSTAFEDINLQKDKLIEALWVQDLTNARAIHHALKPTLELLKIEHINSLLEQAKVFINENESSEIYQNHVAEIAIAFDELIVNIENSISK